MGRNEERLEIERDAQGGFRIAGFGEEGIMLAALVGSLACVFIVGGLLFPEIRGWPLALCGVAIIIGMTYLTKLKFDHVHERKLKALSLSQRPAKGA